ncbi:Uncharacterized protein APZ42_021942 [Daphnia magna]|uniref:Uncharacterized protein n=1 Tax=Daphnia magna TaxID=35525 RepID=A0A164W7F5_9CRUS|nr:Uncharacterized protein APZ42_021942 [Daphnia magna]
MQKTFDQGYASRLLDPASAKYFLVHHGVYKGSKLRLVFDAAAPFRGKSLNDAIISGPALQPALAAVISRFRQEEITWASDIEAMYSGFRLASEDADYFCFLWRGKEADEPKFCTMDRLPFGASCLPFDAIYMVCQIVQDAGVAEHIATVIREQMYIDDYLSSDPSFVEASSEATAAKAALANADLNLQRWISNSRELMLGITTKLPSAELVRLLTCLGVFLLQMFHRLPAFRKCLSKLYFQSYLSVFNFARIACATTNNHPSGKGNQQACTEEAANYKFSSVTARRNADYQGIRGMVIHPMHSQSCRRRHPFYSRREDISYRMDSRTELSSPSGRRMAGKNVVFDWMNIEVKPGNVTALTKLDARFVNLVKSCQNKVYFEDLQGVKKGKPLQTTSSFLAALEQEGSILRYPSEDLLLTPLYKVAGLLHTRPLTYVSSDPADFHPLTPNDFLNRSHTTYPPAGSFDDAPPRDHYRYLQRVLNFFRDLWKTVYLQSLAARKKWKMKQPNFEIRVVVLEINIFFIRTCVVMTTPHGRHLKKNNQKQ